VSDRVVTVLRAITDAPAASVVESLADALAKEYGIGEIELFLVDYRLVALMPVLASAPITRPGDPAWRCFDHQSEVAAGRALYLPVTTRGERQGVLRCSPAPSDAGARAELAEIADLLAHELQWELLPGRSRIRPSFSLAGQLEPAYAVRGDSFDWAERDDLLYLSVLNGMGEGVHAALLTSLATYALRNARRAGLELADQASLADQAVFAEHRGAAHVAALLLELDLRTGEVTAIDAGSPLLMILRDGEVLDLSLDAQFPLGMFETSEYVAQRFSLQSGDRLIVVSDGVVDAANTAAARYGEAALRRFVRRARSLAPLQAVRSLLGDLRTFLADAELEDDAVAVCLDWTGPGH
jgi:serine phosphatase RsbU (regulator of sigma subunit)